MPNEIHNKSPLELHITRNEDMYSFLLKDPSRHTSLLQEKISIPHATRSMILHKLDSLLANMGLLRGIEQPIILEKVNIAQVMTEFGSSIFKFLVPGIFRDDLRAEGPTELIISTNDVEIPWELWYDGSDFLCLKYALGRKVQTRAPFKKISREKKERITALFIADPTGELPNAEKEVSFIVQNVANLGLMDIDYLRKEEASVNNILEKLQSSSYDILHYAGHVEFNAKNPGESTLKLYDDSITAAYLFQIMDNPPRFTFMNACSSARTTGLEYLEGGFVSAFLSSGVDAYVGTLWPVHDEVASDLSVDFYERILRGEPIGLALRNAKKHVFALYGHVSNSWASFLLYGEPSAVLLRKRDWGKLARNEKNIRKKVEYYSKHLESSPTDAETWRKKGLALGELGRYEEAMGCYDKALEINPRYGESWCDKASLFKRLGKPEEEISCYDKVIEIDPANAKVWNLKGVALRRLGRIEHALECYERALQAEPKLYEAWNNKGYLLSTLGRYEEAIRCYDEALEIRPTYSLAWDNKGDAFVCLGRHEDAIRCYDRQQEINASSYAPWFKKGDSLAKLGRYEEAIDCYDKALRIVPDSAGLLWRKAKAFARAGRSEEAIRCCDQILKIDPNHEEAKDKKRQLEEKLAQGKRVD